MALRHNAEVDANRITIETNGDEVILSGIVRSWLERHEAELAAWSEPGVTKVEDWFIGAHPWPPHFSQNRPKLIWLAILTAVNAPSAYCTYQARLITWSRRTCRPNNVIGLDLSVLQETNMRQLIQAGAITIAVFSSIDIAAAQTAPATAQADLTPSQERMVSQGLASSPSQPAPPGAQPQVGNRIPDTMSAQALPNNVTDQVPNAKGLFFVKLPDRIVLIDPHSKLVTEILMDATTTGSSPAGSSPPSR